MFGIGLIRVAADVQVTDAVDICVVAENTGQIAIDDGDVDKIIGRADIVARLQEYMARSGTGIGQDIDDRCRRVIEQIENRIGGTQIYRATRSNLADSEVTGIHWRAFIDDVDQQIFARAGIIDLEIGDIDRRGVDLDQLGQMHLVEIKDITQVVFLALRHCKTAVIRVKQRGIGSVIRVIDI